MKRLWVVDGTISLRAYFYSDAKNVGSSAVEALTEKMDDDSSEWSFGSPVEVLSLSQIDSYDLKNDASIYRVGDDPAPDSLSGWTGKLQELAELTKQKQREAEAAARQLKLFGDDGT